MNRKEQYSIGELTVDTIIGGDDSCRKKIYLNGALGSDGADGLAYARPMKTLANAYAKLETLKGDIIVLEESASALSLATGFTFAKSLSGIVGTSWNDAYARSRISHSAAMATMLTVSGYGNKFANIRLMFGTASATNKTALSVTNSGNTFRNVNIAGTDTTTMAESDFRLVSIAADENYFDTCQIGNINAAQAAGTLVYFDASCTPNMTFRDCTFLMNASANAAFFLQFAAGVGESVVKFYNCQFINTGTTLTYGIDGTGLNNCIVYLDSRCSFYGVTDIVAHGQDAYVISGVTNSPTAAEDTLWHIAAPVDTTA
jgi:Tfp pilus assembly protein PilE